MTSWLLLPPLAFLGMAAYFDWKDKTLIPARLMHLFTASALVVRVWLGTDLWLYALMAGPLFIFLYVASWLHMMGEAEAWAMAGLVLLFGQNVVWVLVIAFPLEILTLIWSVLVLKHGLKDAYPLLPALFFASILYFFSQ